VWQESLLQKRDFQQCLACAELALSEALQQLASADSADSSSAPPPPPPHTREAWLLVITQLLAALEVCFAEDAALLADVPRYSSMARLANNLIQVAPSARALRPLP